MYLCTCYVYVKHSIYFNNTTFIYTVDDLHFFLVFRLQFLYCAAKKQKVLVFCKHSLTSLSRAGDSRFLG